MADHDPWRRQKIFNNSKAQGKAKIEPNRVAIASAGKRGRDKETIAL
nr:hypothetical protein [Methylocella silvestris]